MEFKITEKKENPLLERTEIKFMVSFSGVTPKFDEVRGELIKFLKADEKLTILDGVHQEFGRHEASGYVKVYANASALKVEPKHRLTKNLEGKKKKEKSAGAEEGSSKEAPEKKPGKEDKKEEKTPKEKSVKDVKKEPKGEEKGASQETTTAKESKEGV